MITLFFLLLLLIPLTASGYEFEFVVMEVCFLDTTIDGMDGSCDTEHILTVSESEGVCFYDYASWTSTFIADAVDMSHGICMLPQSTGYLYCQNTGSSSNLALCDSLGTVVWTPGNPAGTMGLGMSSDGNGFIWEIEINEIPNSGGTLHKMRLEGELLITENSWDLPIDSPYGITATPGGTGTLVFVTDLQGDYIYCFDVSASEIVLYDEIPVPVAFSEDRLSRDISHRPFTSYFYLRARSNSYEILLELELQTVESLEQATWAGIKNSFPL